ncbi:MAG: sulfatase-like hydrolase/transferase [Verrucomicrobiota bacterium]|nr:sulfatase-like hydrolase/transferase [Verrucomicrobiota bacterium]
MLIHKVVKSSITNNIIALLCFFFFLLGTEAKPPNVIIILTDDQGSVDAGCYGSKDLITPNIDSLATRGIRFTQFYSAAPVCSPSRAGLLTGRYPIHAGVPGNTTSQKGKPGMPGEQITIAEHFKAAGYKTAHIGKWHLGYIPEHMPNQQGFDYSFGHMGGCIDNYSHFFYWQGPNRHDLHRNGKEIFEDGKFFPDLMVRETCEFIKNNQGSPFLIYFALNTPHYPYQGEAHWLKQYKELAMPRKLYNAFVSTQDARIGSLLHYLDEVGLRNDTIIVFQSDHGHSTEERAHFGGGNSGPYRGAKFSLYEGGIRVPAIISWPSKLAEGKEINQLAHSCDWLPTLAELANIKLINNKIDGKSLAPLLLGKENKSPHKILHWQVGRNKNSQWAVREGEWKLIGNVRDTSNPPAKNSAPPAKLFLSNLKKDPGEKQNFVKIFPQIVSRLMKAHELEANK